MTKIAILGASGHIAKSLIDYYWQHDRSKVSALYLFARTPEKVNRWLDAHGISIPNKCRGLSELSEGSFDLVLNAIGTTNSADVQRLGAQVFDTALEHDETVLRYIKGNPACRYCFLSSGAVYGRDFSEPVQQTTLARHSINSTTEIDWYGVSKFCVEARHRAQSNFAIVDIRIFSYFSSWIDLAQPFLLTDALRAISNNSVLHTDASDFWRDYVGAADLAQLLDCIMSVAPCNLAVDLYSREPIRKQQVLDFLSRNFCLRYTKEGSRADVPSNRAMYFSKNHIAAGWGYSPDLGSQQLLEIEVPKILKALLK
jgi:nucleoside-diphosphate-sugar epimerase